MQNHAAVFRDKEILETGEKSMAEVWKSFDDLSTSDRSLIWNSDLMEALELDNLRSQALITIASATNRTESRGAHARDDFTERDDDNWMKHTYCWLDEQGGIKFDYRPVNLHTRSPTENNQCHQGKGVLVDAT